MAVKRSKAPRKRGGTLKVSTAPKFIKSPNVPIINSAVPNEQPRAGRLARSKVKPFSGIIPGGGGFL